MTSRPCAELSSDALGEHLGHDRGRAHRQRAAQRETREPAEAEQLQHDHRHDRRDRDLREAQGRTPRAASCSAAAG